MSDFITRNILGSYYDRIINLKIKTLNQNFVTVDEFALNLSDLYIYFEGMKTINPEQNSIIIKLRNISDDTLNKCAKLGQLLELDVGYRYFKGAGLLFSGTIQKIHHELDGQERITIIECYDGANILKDRFISLSFSKGTPVKNALDQIKDALRIPYYINSV